MPIHPMLRLMGPPAGQVREMFRVNGPFPPEDGVLGGAHPGLGVFIHENVQAFCRSCSIPGAVIVCRVFTVLPFQNSLQRATTCCLSS